MPDNQLQIKPIQKNFLIYGGDPDVGFHYTTVNVEYFLYNGYGSLLPCDECHPEMYRNANNKSVQRFIKTIIDIKEFGEIECYLQEGNDQGNRYNYPNALYHFKKIIKHKDLNTVDELIEYINSKYPTFNIS